MVLNSGGKKKKKRGIISKIVATILGIGPSGVRALPLAAGINEGGHYFRYFFLFLLPPLFKTTEGGVPPIFFWLES